MVVLLIWRVPCTLYDVLCVTGDCLRGDDVRSEPRVVVDDPDLSAHHQLSNSLTVDRYYQI